MKKLLTSTALIMMIISSQAQTFAASEDNEISIMAAEQRVTNEADVTVSEEVETFDNDPHKNEPPPEQNSENNSGNEPQPADTSNTQENTPEIINPDIDAANLANENNNNENNDNKNNSNVNENNNNLSNPAINSNPVINNAGTANPIKTYSNFNDAAKKIGYVPLYIPRKSGYTMDYIAVISDEIAEIRYGRRWEPTVTLSVRTYKRAAGEKLKDISGVYGVKWKIDTTSGTTIYIARISDTSSVAVWAVGQYTFAAMTENLSFAAFHSLIVEELVDLCNHYFIDV